MATGVKSQAGGRKVCGRSPGGLGRAEIGRGRRKTGPVPLPGEVGPSLG